MLMHIDVMKDASEIICYDRTGIPLHVRVGELSSFPDKKALCHWHDDIEFIRVLHGEMNYYINGRSILLKENNAIMVNSRQMHYSYSVQQKDCTFICILFHPSLFTGNKLLNQNYILPLLRNKNLEYLYFDLQNGDDGGILDLLDRISALREKSMDLYELEIVGLMHILWSRLYRQIVSKRLHTPEQDSNNSDIMLQKDMVSYIHQHYAERLTLSDIAASGNVCRSKCCKIFKRYLMQSPIEFLNTYRLEISSNLLKDTSKSVTEVAFACGFNHLSYYSELFKRYYGCTPSEYRKRGYDFQTG